MSNATQTVVGEINEFIGTVAYMAPEVITQQKKAGHGRKADIWSIACCVVEMATGDRPYGEKCDGSWMFIYQLGSGAIPRYVAVHVSIISTHIHTRPPHPSALDWEGKVFLDRCFERDPSKRPDVKELLEMPFVKPMLDWKRATCACGCQSAEQFDLLPSPSPTAANAPRIGSTGRERIASTAPGHRMTKQTSSAGHLPPPSPLPPKVAAMQQAGQGKGSALRPGKP